MSLLPRFTNKGAGAATHKPSYGSDNADEDQASKLQHAVECMDGNVHFVRPTPILA